MPKGHTPTVSPAEFALFCWLRLHPKEAATYGIEVCDGKTTIGSMLVQTLRSQGMDVKWHLQVPNGVINDESTSNEKGAAFIKSVGVRPGARKKQLSERPEVASNKRATSIKRTSPQVAAGEAGSTVRSVVPISKNMFSKDK